MNRGSEQAPQLVRHGKEVEAVFDLLGFQENDLTSSLAFTLTRSPALLAGLLREIGAKTGNPQSVSIETRDANGRTDLEIETSGALLVIEAKRGWNLPSDAQLQRYVPRIKSFGGGQLITLSDCSDEWAARKLPLEVGGVTVRHLSWERVRAQLQLALHKTRGTERLWLRELNQYLRRAVRMTDVSDSWTYCVVLSPKKYGPHTFREFVTEENVYFHPFGGKGGWPKSPPNFIAFRWNNYVQQVRRVISSRVVEDLRTIWPTVPEEPPHIIHTLGPPMKFEPIPTGRTYRASRMWVLLDQLFSCPTLAEALKETDKLKGNQNPSIVFS